MFTGHLFEIKGVRQESRDTATAFPMGEESDLKHTGQRKTTFINTAHDYAITRSIHSSLVTAWSGLWSFKLCR